LLSFNPNQEPSVPRDAATVVVIRDTPKGIEVFCVLRHQKSSFLGGAVVFPGGKVDAADAVDEWIQLVTTPHPRASVFATDAGHARALSIAACRETLEEGRILPVEGALDARELDALHAALVARPGSLREELAQRGLRLALDGLVPWGRWVTPTAEPRRFDARFFLLELPPGQEGRHDEHETTMSFWSSPAGVLERFARGEIFLAPPTTRTLELLADARDARQAMALAAEQPLLPVCPRFVPSEPVYLALPGDPSHEVQERRIAGPSRFVLRDGRFVSEEPPAASQPNERDARHATGSQGE